MRNPTNLTGRRKRPKRTKVGWAAERQIVRRYFSASQPTAKQLGLEFGVTARTVYAYLNRHPDLVKKLSPLRRAS